MHPIDGAHLLAIGTEQGSVKLSLFDVGILSSPRELDSRFLRSSSSSEAQQEEHHAFTWFPERKMLAIPFLEWKWEAGSRQRDLLLFEVDPLGLPTPITNRGKVPVTDLCSSGSSSRDGSRAARRSVMADDFVYAICDAGIRVAGIEAPHAPLAALRFERAT